MNVEDRIRAAAHARVDLVREIRPLEIPERLPRRGFRAPRSRHLIGWLAPVTAAAVVVVLAIALVSVRQARNDGGIPGRAQVTPASGPAIPRDYVSVSPGVSGAAAIVADSRTGAVLAMVKPPAHRAFAGVTGTAGDRTFVLDTVPASGRSGQGTHVWYLLRVDAGTAHPATLTRLPVAGPPVSAYIQGIALSPDGRTLAVLFRPATLKSGESYTLRTYSLATGKPLRTWTTLASELAVTSFPDPDNIAALSWVGGRTLAFRFPVYVWPDYVRLLDTASKGSDFVKASKSVLADPGDQRSCASLQTATDGRTVVCGTEGNATGGCVKEEPEFDLWSTATGKLTRVLYRYGGECQAAIVDVLWAGPGGTVIGVILAYTYDGKKEHTKITAGLVSHGRFTPLRISVPSSATMPGDIAF